MYDIFVNNQLVAVVAEPFVKIFISTLVDRLPVEMSIVSRQHIEPQPTEQEKPKEKTK